MMSDVARLRELLLQQGQAVYLGFYGHVDVARQEIIRQRNLQMSPIIQQLDSQIGEEETDSILCEMLEMSFLAYKKEQQQIQAQMREYQQREPRKKPGVKGSRRQQ